MSVTYILSSVNKPVVYDFASGMIFQLNRFLHCGGHLTRVNWTQLALLEEYCNEARRPPYIEADNRKRLTGRHGWRRSDKLFCFFLMTHSFWNIANHPIFHLLMILNVKKIPFSPDHVGFYLNSWHRWLIDYVYWL